MLISLGPLLALALVASASPRPQPQPRSLVGLESHLQPREQVSDDQFIVGGISVILSNKNQGLGPILNITWNDYLKHIDPKTGRTVTNNETICRIPIHDFGGTSGSWFAILGLDPRMITTVPFGAQPNEPGSPPAKQTFACYNVAWTATYNLNQNTTGGFNITLRHAVSFDGKPSVIREGILSVPNGLADFTRSQDEEIYVWDSEATHDSAINVTTYPAPAGIPRDSWLTFSAT